MQRSTLEKCSIMLISNKLGKRQVSWDPAAVFTYSEQK